MTFFDKLSGLAQRARDNAAAKMVVAKDKRLEQSLSGAMGPEDAVLSQMASYGLPGPVCMVAFDSVAGLLAVAGSDYLRIFGKGVSCVVPVPNDLKRFKHVQFHAGRSKLIVIDTRNAIYYIDIATKRTRSIHSERTITSCESCVDTDWLFVGFVDGTVGVIDLQQMKLVEYAIPDLVNQWTCNQGTASSGNESHFVTALQMHPIDLNTLLIGYEAAAFLWNIREQSVRRVYALQQPTVDEGNPAVQLTCLAWSPEGDRFVAGYDDGYLRIWDEREEKRPAMSRRVLEIPSAKDDSNAQQPCEPVYRLSWFLDGQLQKSFLVVAGGVNIAGLDGLHVLEFDIDSDEKAPRKQSNIPSSVHVADFTLLGSGSDDQNQQSPAGLIIVGNDGSVRAHDLQQHGYQPLTLPSAFYFLDPPAIHACHISMLPDTTFRRLSAPVRQDGVKYLPLTGGETGPGHVYKLDSRDILLTIHTGENIKVWDAAYTSLRPLEHLNIACRKHEPDASICCLDLNTTSGSLSVGFDSGAIIVYDLVEPEVEVPGQRFVDQCDDTLKEISELLESMSETKEEDQKEPEKTAQSSQVSIQILARKNKSTAYVPAMRISTNHGLVEHVVSGGTLLAFSTAHGKVYVIDIATCQEIFYSDMHGWEPDTTVPEKTFKDSMTITHLKLVNTYSPDKVSFVATQLLVGLGNGYVYQYSISNKAYGQAPIFRSSAQTPVVDTHVIDLNGCRQTTVNAVINKSSPSLSRQSEKDPDNEASSSPSTTSPEADVQSNKSAPRRSFSLRRKPTKKKGSDVTPPLPEPGEESLLPSASSRAWPDYEYQEDPHLLVILNTTSISVLLSGFNIKLSSCQLDTMDGWQASNRLVSGEVLCFEGAGTCLSVILQTAEILLFSLPDLKPLASLTLGDHGVFPSESKMNEASLTPDGRLVVWTGKYELRQFVYMAQNDIPFGESVQFQTHRSKKPSASADKVKKSWLNTVTGAFQKNPMTVDELNMLMGRVEIEDTNQTPKISSAGQQGSSTIKKGGVFQELNNKVNERGEKLNDLGQKLGEMKDASSDFVKAINEYNKRQEQKKWWEF